MKKKANQGLNIVKEAILEYLDTMQPIGAGTSQIAKELGLQSDMNGSYKNYLTWSVLGILLSEGKVQKIGRSAGSKWKKYNLK